MSRVVEAGHGSSVRTLQVVVVAYGSPELLHRCLQALGARDPVTVVDNSSMEEVEAVVRACGARYVDPGTNLGYAAAVNLALSGIDLLGSDVLLLNPDSSIESAQLDTLRRALDDDQTLAGVAPSQRAQSGGAQLPARWPWHSPRRAWAEAIGLRPPGEGFLSGAVLLLRGRSLSEVGPFDERFFLYAEDEDWQRRALDAGWQLELCEEVTAIHASGGTQPDVARQQLRLHCATERYVRKWSGRTGWYTYRAGTIVGQLLRGAVRGGWRRRQALRLAWLYVIGPDRSARRSGAVPDGRTEPRRRASPASRR